MRFSFLGALCGATLLFGSADKSLPIEDNSNELVQVTASLLDKDQAKQELGADPGPGILVMRVRVRPLTDKPIRVDRDDFFLLSTGDGQHSTPLDASEIAGGSTLVLRSQDEGSIGVERQRPTMIAGPIATGTSPRSQSNTQTVKSQTKTAGNPALLAALKEKILPDKETDDPVSGLLYFPTDGKLKIKDLELYYKTPGGKLGMRFRP